MKKLVTFLFCLICFVVQSYNESIALSLGGTSSHINGPNCWNGALYVSNVVDSKRFMSPEEWAHTLQYNCKEVSAPRYGDIGRIQDYLGNEVHGFIYLDKESVFAKHGQATRDGYDFMSFEKMLFYYGRHRNCRMSNSHDDYCYNKITYYQCDRKVVVNHHVAVIGELFEELVFSPESKLKFKDKCASDSFVLREQVLSEILTELTVVKRISHFLKRSDKLMLQSLVTQLSDVEVSNRNFRCTDRKRKKLVLRQVKTKLKKIINEII